MPATPSDVTGARWRKSSRSPNLADCVEIASAPGLVGVRDSKDPCGPRLTFAEAEWRNFLRTARAGRYDLS